MTASFPPASSVTDNSAFAIDVCWGLSPSRLQKDGEVTASTDSQAAFSAYVASGGLLSDTLSLCDYLNLHRSDYMIPSWWNHTQDCFGSIYNTYSKFYVGRNISQSSVLVTWAAKTVPDMIGVKMVGTDSAVPIWACTNITITLSKAFSASDIMDLSNRWENAVQYVGSNKAALSGVPVFVASENWSNILLANDMEKSLFFAGLLICLLVPAFTFIYFRNIIVSILFGVFWIALISCVCLIKSLLFEYLTINQYDIYAVALCGGLLSFNPSYLILKYIQRDNQLKKDGVVMEAQRHDVLHMELRRMKLALTPPAVASVVIGVPLLFSNIELCIHCGRAIIVSAILSIYLSLMTISLIMTLSCETNTNFLAWMYAKCLCLCTCLKCVHKKPSFPYEEKLVQDV